MLDIDALILQAESGLLLPHEAKALSGVVKEILSELRELSKKDMNIPAQCVRVRANNTLLRCRKILDVPGRDYNEKRRKVSGH